MSVVSRKNTAHLPYFKCSLDFVLYKASLFLNVRYSSKLIFNIQHVPYHGTMSMTSRCLERSPRPSRLPKAFSSREERRLPDPSERRKSKSQNSFLIAVHLTFYFNSSESLDKKISCACSNANIISSILKF